MGEMATNKTSAAKSSAEPTAESDISKEMAKTRAYILPIANAPDAGASWVLTREPTRQQQWKLEAFFLLLDELYRSAGLVAELQWRIQAQWDRTLQLHKSWESLYRRSPTRSELALLEEADRFDSLGTRLRNMVMLHASQQELVMIANDMGVIRGMLRDIQLYTTGWRLMRQNAYLRWNINNCQWAEFTDWGKWRFQNILYPRGYRGSGRPKILTGTHDMTQRMVEIRDELIGGSLEFQRMLRDGEVDAVRAKAEELVDLTVQLANAQTHVENQIWYAAEERRRHYLGANYFPRKRPFSDVLHQLAGYMDMRAVEDTCMWPLHIAWLEPHEMRPSERRRKLREWNAKFLRGHMDRVPGRPEGWSRVVKGWDGLKLSGHSVMWKLCLLEARIVTNCERQYIEERVLFRDMLWALERKLDELLLVQTTLRSLGNASKDPEVVSEAHRQLQTLPLALLDLIHSKTDTRLLYSQMSRRARRSRSAPEDIDVPDTPVYTEKGIRYQSARLPQIHSIYPRITSLPAGFTVAIKSDPVSHKRPDIASRLDPNNNDTENAQSSKKAKKKRQKARKSKEECDANREADALLVMAPEEDTTPFILGIMRPKSIPKGGKSQFTEKEMKHNGHLATPVCLSRRSPSTYESGTDNIGAHTDAVEDPWRASIPKQELRTRESSHWIFRTLEEESKAENGDPRVCYFKRSIFDLTRMECKLMHALKGIDGLQVKTIAFDNGGIIKSNTSSGTDFSLMVGVKGEIKGQVTVAKKNSTDIDGKQWDCKYAAPFNLYVFLYTTNLMPYPDFQRLVRFKLEDMLDENQTRNALKQKKTKGPKRKRYSEEDLRRKALTLRTEAVDFTKVNNMFRTWHLSMETNPSKFRKLGEEQKLCFVTDEMRIAFGKSEPYYTLDFQPRGVDATVELDKKMFLEYGDIIELRQTGLEFEKVRSSCLFDFISKMASVVQALIQRDSEEYIEELFIGARCYPRDSLENNDACVLVKEPTRDESPDHSPSRTSLSTCSGRATLSEIPGLEDKVGINSPKAISCSQGATKKIVKDERNLTKCIDSSSPKNTKISPIEQKLIPGAPKMSRDGKVLDAQKQNEELLRKADRLDESEKPTNTSKGRGIYVGNPKQACLHHDRKDHQKKKSKPNVTNDFSRVIETINNSNDSGNPSSSKKGKKKTAPNINAGKRSEKSGKQKGNKQKAESQHPKNAPKKRGRGYWRPPLTVREVLKTIPEKKSAATEQAQVDNVSKELDDSGKGEGLESKTPDDAAPTDANVFEWEDNRFDVLESIQEEGDEELLAEQLPRSYFLLKPENHYFHDIAYASVSNDSDGSEDSQHGELDNFRSLFTGKESVSQASYDIRNDTQQYVGNLCIPSCVQCDENSDVNSYPTYPNRNSDVKPCGYSLSYNEETKSYSTDVLPSPSDTDNDPVESGNCSSVSSQEPPTNPTGRRVSARALPFVEELTHDPLHYAEERLRQLVLEQRTVLTRLVDDLTLEAGTKSREERLATQVLMRDKAWNQMQDLYRAHRAGQLALMDHIVMENEKRTRRIKLLVDRGILLHTSIKEMNSLDRVSLTQLLKIILEDMQMMYRNYSVFSPVYPNDYPDFKMELPRLHETRILQGRKVTTV